LCHETRWQLIAYIVRDIIRAVDCTPGLSQTLREIRDIAKGFFRKRKRVRQTQRMTLLLS